LILDSAVQTYHVLDYAKRADKTGYGKNHEPDELTLQRIQQTLAIFRYPRPFVQSVVFSAVFRVIDRRENEGVAKRSSPNFLATKNTKNEAREKRLRRL
jgi:hypothetical protein